MNVTPEQYEQINRFLDLEMTEAEMKMFEEALLTHPEMRTQLDFELSVRETFAAAQQTEIFEENAMASNSVPVQATPVYKMNKRKRWLIPAAAVITGGIIVFALMYDNGANNKPKGLNQPIAQNKPTQDTLPVQKKIIPAIKNISKKTLNTDSLFKG
jgi:hypothetical protein